MPTGDYPAGPINSPPAFPMPASVYGESDIHVTGISGAGGNVAYPASGTINNRSHIYHRQELGMSRLDYFAGQALPGVLAAILDRNPDFASDPDDQHVGRLCYSIAMGMEQARKDLVERGDIVP